MPTVILKNDLYQLRVKEKRKRFKVNGLFFWIFILRQIKNVLYKRFHENCFSDLNLWNEKVNS